MIAEIISVGTELLMGQTVNTDATFIAKNLVSLGIDMYYCTTIGDNANRLNQVLDTALTRSDIIITSGGLGPTDDDMTKECISKHLGLNMVLDKTSFEKIQTFMNQFNNIMSPNNKKQAYFPSGAKILPNDVGTAPGCIIELDNKCIIILPGPPSELNAMFTNYVLPYLKSKSDAVIFSKNVQLFGIGESQAEYLMTDIVKDQTNPTIATYCHPGLVTIRITAKATDEQSAKKIIEPTLKKVIKLFEPYIYEIGDKTLNQIVADYLLSNHLTISCAESCSGGLVADSFVSLPGISSVFMLGVVSYSNQAKIDQLGVKKSTLDAYGAVSKETALEMVAGVKKISGTSIGVSTTGIAGPGCDNSGKPVGLVYIAIDGPNGSLYEELHFKGTRDKIRSKTVLAVLNMIRKYFNISYKNNN